MLVLIFILKYYTIWNTYNNSFYLSFNMIRKIKKKKENNERKITMDKVTAKEMNIDAGGYSFCVSLVTH